MLMNRLPPKRRKEHFKSTRINNVSGCAESFNPYAPCCDDTPFNTVEYPAYSQYYDLQADVEDWSITGQFKPSYLAPNLAYYRRPKPEDVYVNTGNPRSTAYGCQSRQMGQECQKQPQPTFNCQAKDYMSAVGYNSNEPLYPTIRETTGVDPTWHDLSLLGDCTKSAKKEQFQQREIEKKERIHNNLHQSYFNSTIGVSDIYHTHMPSYLYDLDDYDSPELTNRCIRHCNYYPSPELTSKQLQHGHYYAPALTSAQLSLTS